MVEKTRSFVRGKLGYNSRFADGDYPPVYPQAGPEKDEGTRWGWKKRRRKSGKFSSRRPCRPSARGKPRENQVRGYDPADVPRGVAGRNERPSAEGRAGEAETETGRPAGDGARDRGGRPRLIPRRGGERGPRGQPPPPGRGRVRPAARARRRRRPPARRDEEAHNLRRPGIPPRHAEAVGVHERRRLRPPVAGHAGCLPRDGGGVLPSLPRRHGMAGMPGEGRLRRDGGHGGRCG